MNEVSQSPRERGRRCQDFANPVLWLEFRAGRNPLGNGDVDVRTLTIYNDTDGVDRRPSQSPRERGRRCQLGEPQMEYEVEGATSQSPRERGRRCQLGAWLAGPWPCLGVAIPSGTGTSMSRVQEVSDTRCPLWCRNPLGNGDVDVSLERVYDGDEDFDTSQSPRERGRRCQKRRQLLTLDT